MNDEWGQAPGLGRSSRRRGGEGRNTAGLRILNQTTAAVLEDRWAALCTETGTFAIEIFRHPRWFWGPRSSDSIRLPPKGGFVRGSGDQSHPAMPRRIAIKRCRVIASRPFGRAFDQTVGEVGAPALEQPNGLPGGLGALDLEPLRAQQSLQYGDHVVFAAGVSASEHPDQFG